MVAPSVAEHTGRVATLFSAVVRRVLVPVAATDGNGGQSLMVDALNLLWTRSAPAQSVTPITPNDAAALTATFRALRFDVAGTVKFDGPGGTAITRNVQAGEIWPYDSVAITKIYATGTTASGIDALG